MIEQEYKKANRKIEELRECLRKLCIFRHHGTLREICNDLKKEQIEDYKEEVRRKEEKRKINEELQVLVVAKERLEEEDPEADHKLNLEFIHMTSENDKVLHKRADEEIERYRKARRDHEKLAENIRLKIIELREKECKL